MYRTARTSVKTAGTDGVITGPRAKSLGTGTLFEPDWTGTVAASWETRDKHWSIQLFAGDLFTKAELRGEPRHPSFSITAKVRY